ncbi:11546_t:CDS:2 [Paraglomus brasilianum]|uniref:11546_t:CDS:1 n=1 Tax=Paraglomus brasilianum TaxID=144538 RepID=A0A9N9AH57_9GLOM|nr:11546_t:CDS:2 [Paraglomus brasilianum]
MPRSPSPRPEYSRRSHGHSDYRDSYRDRDRPSEDVHPRRRSRSPGRDKYDRRDRRSHDRYSRTKERRKSRSRSKSRSPRKDESTNVVEVSIDPDEEPEKAMLAFMGISGFSTTKGAKVTGNDMSAVNIKKQRQYRQYMNRRGGFNRPLDKVQ